MAPENAGRSESNDIGHEHQELRHQLDSLQAALSDVRTDRARAAGLLRGMASGIEQHFQREERPDGLRQLISVAPRLKSRVDVVLAQHAQFRGELADLIAAASSSAGADWRSELAQRFAAFAEQFLAHEHEENALLQEAYHRDMAAED